MNAREVLSILVIVFALSLFGCGGSNGNSAPSTGTTGSSTGSTGSSSTSGTSSSSSSTTSTSSSSGTTTGPEGNLHILTGLCRAPGGCPSNEVPYRVVLNIEFERTNGWISVGQADTGGLGEITITGLPVGNYRISMVNPEPSFVTPAATANAQTAVITDGVTTDAVIQFTP